MIYYGQCFSFHLHPVCMPKKKKKGGQQVGEKNVEFAHNEPNMISNPNVITVAGGITAQRLNGYLFKCISVMWMRQCYTDFCNHNFFIKHMEKMRECGHERKSPYS